MLLGPRRVGRSGDVRSITELKYHFINLHLLDSILLSTKMKGLAHLQISKRLKEIDFKKINEDKYRSRDRDEKNAKKKEEARLRALEKSNMQCYVVAEVSKKNDPTAARKRGILSIPATSVTHEE